ncbi:Vsp/OspC family lipoprotein [Borrelia persica]|uniref:Vsp/OspC family lipoprotein n=1 Tax=Borrelia persica TaxID=44448 RepID=UPI0004ACA8B7|nr:Vsp/OspC family lipoprotein [Borrelia persica]
MKNEGKEMRGIREVRANYDKGGIGKMKEIIKRSLIIMMILGIMGCNSGGSGGGNGSGGKTQDGKEKEGIVTRSDGIVLDLAKLSKKIREASKFAASVKEVHALVKSVGDFAKGIGKKVTQNTGVIAADAGGNNNGQIVAGAYGLISDVNIKVETLRQKDGISTELKAKFDFDDVVAKGKAFLDKVKGDSDLCKKDVTDEHAKKALDVNDASKDKGAKELVEFNTAMDELLKLADKEVESAIIELTPPPAKVASA